VEVPKSFQFDSKYDLLPTENTLTNQLKSYSNPKDAANLLKVVKQGKNLQQEHLQYTMKKLAETNDLEELKSLIDLWKFKQYPEESTPYAFLLDAYLRTTDSEIAIFQAEELWKEMKVQKIIPSAETYDCLIYGLTMKNMDLRAYDLLKEMKDEHKMKPSLNTYRTLLLGLTDENHFEHAREIYHMILQDYGASPSKDISRIVLTGYAHAGDVDSVKELLANTSSDPELLAFLIDAHSRAKSDLSVVEELLSTDARLASYLKESNRFVLSALLNFHAARDDLDRALATLKTIKDSGAVPEPYAYKKLLEHYTRKGDTKAALELFTTMERDGLFDFETCEIMGRHFAGLGDNRSWFELLAELARRNIPMTIEAYHITIECLLVSEDAEEARRVFETMKEDGFHPNSQTYHLFIRHFCANGAMVEANQYFEEMLKESIQPEDDVYLTMMLGYTRKGDMKNAAPLIKYLSSGNRIQDLVLQDKE